MIKIKIQKIKKLVPMPKKNENKNILLEYFGDVDDKLCKECSNGKNFNSFINESCNK